MPDHLTPQQIQDYQRRTLAPTDRLEVSNHLHGCDDCRQRVKSGMTLTKDSEVLIADAAEGPTEEHLTYDEMTAYLDGNSDPQDRVFVDSHIAGCASCAFQFRALQQFRAILSTLPPEVYEPAALPKRVSFWSEWLSAFDRRRLAPMLGAMAAAGLTVFLFMRLHPVSSNPSISLQVAQRQALLARQQAAAQQQEAQRQRAERERSDQQLAQTRARLTREEAASQRKEAMLHRALVSAQRQASRTPPRLVALLRQLLIDRPLATLAVSTATLRSSGEGPLAPVGTCVREVRPRFSWNPVNGATSYDVVIVQDKTGAPISSFSVGAALSGTPRRNLLRSQALRWFIRSRIPGQPDRVSGVARFRILTLQEIQALSEDLRLVKQMNAERDTGILTGKVLWHYGLLDEAQRAFEQAAPANSNARDLLRRLRQQREAPQEQ